MAKSMFEGHLWDFREEKWPFFDAVVNAVAAPKVASKASAFCGSSQGSREGKTMRAASSSRSLPFLPKPENLGGLAGGEAEFDPLGFSDTFDVKWLREAELKHGRVCALDATLSAPNTCEACWPPLALWLSSTCSSLDSQLQRSAGDLLSHSACAGRPERHLYCTAQHDGLACVTRSLLGFRS